MTSDDGPLVTQAYVCKAKGEDLVLEDITLPPMKATFVELDMTHCGLCHTDIHMKDNEWGVSDYPVVLGHEGVGVVRKVGSSVRYLKIGDVVGVTWIRDSCAECAPCMEGRENLCGSGYQGVYLGAHAGPWGRDPHNEHGGCFSKVMRIEERFAIKLPDGVTPEVACPLLCGGGTVYEPIVDYVQCGTRVAIASIGGLGTAAIRFSKSFGGYVTALSRSEVKREKCLAAGADEYYGCLGQPDKMKELTGRFDVIIDTSPYNSNVADYMDMLKFNGTYLRVGIPPANDMCFSYSYIPLIFTQKKIAGSIVTGTRRMKRMLQLVADQPKIYATTNEEWKAEIVPYEQINEVMATLAKGENKKSFRYVFKW